ncbi:MAG: hypothetical protein FVQ85_20995 [Planctomycetes bacterium]|nr:hypothetical protein [Planctomycetota bacterium]
MAKKKPKYDEYKKWLKDIHDIEIINTTKLYYERVANKIKGVFEKSNLWKGLISNYNSYGDQFYIDSRGYHLWSNPIEPVELKIKSFDSFLLKTYRKNILDNKDWPEPPKGEWILPNNWFSKINDIVRTSFVVKYLDGVEYVTKHFQLLCKEFKVTSTVDYEAKEEGYYAAHMYVTDNFEIPKIVLGTVFVNVSIEFQITTQLQEVIKKLLHKHYEERRKKEKLKGNIKWQWDYKSDEFATNYLGHILHYVEGMIMERRGRIGGKKT